MGELVRKILFRLAIFCMFAALVPILSAQIDEQIETHITRLQATPVLHNTSTDTVHEIFQYGQMLGNRSNVFTVVGDSNSANGTFMRPIAFPELCDLGEYGHLQETIDFFWVPPRDGVSNSFINPSVASDIGYSTSIVLNPFWAEDSACQPNETPLACEYRIVQPSVAIIMLGNIDMSYDSLDVETYRQNMDLIMRSTIERGIIPVLTTFIVLPDRPWWENSIAADAVLLDLADQYNTPVINLWAALQSLPDYGVDAGGSHLKAIGGRMCMFDGTERQLGATLRNLLTLQALDELRRNVLTVPAASNT